MRRAFCGKDVRVCGEGARVLVTVSFRGLARFGGVI